MSLDLKKWFAQVQPTWMVRALNMGTPEVPRGLRLDRDATFGDQPSIQCVLDAYQGGIAIGAVEADTNAQLPDLAALAPLQFIGADANGVLNSDVVNTAGLMTSMSVIPTGLAADRTFSLEIGNNVLDIVLSRSVVVTAGNIGASWKDIAGHADARIYIPPGWFVLARAIGLVAAEKMTVETQILRVPAGFKPF